MLGRDRERRLRPLLGDNENLGLGLKVCWGFARALGSHLIGWVPGWIWLGRGGLGRLGMM